MKATLVSHYGEKPEKLRTYLSGLQEILKDSLSVGFRAYTLEQIHATIIGFESVDFDAVSPASILAFLGSGDLSAFDVRIGGYSSFKDYGFLSQEQHPAMRSFSIQGDTAVAMGWPVGGASHIDHFRRSFNPIGIHHKWHKTDFDVDNDFYFVLGRLELNLIAEEKRIAVEQRVRNFMADQSPVLLKVDKEALAIVFYRDRELPPDTSIIYDLTDKSLTADRFQAHVGAQKINGL